MNLEKDLNNLRNDYEQAVEDCDKANARIEYLEEELARIVIKQENDANIVTKNLQQEVNRLSLENEKYRETSRVHVEEISDPEKSLKVKTEISNQLNKKLSELKAKNEKENAATKKVHKAQIKSWRKELGEVRKDNIKLQEKLEKQKTNNENKKITKKGSKGDKSQNITPVLYPYETETFCSLCAIVIPDYIPEYFCGERYNPACQSCKASDDLWDPNDPFSAFPSPSPPVSLVSHWLLPPKEQPPQNPSSIISLRSHCLTFDSSKLDKEKLNDEEDFKEWMKEFREQLRVDRNKILEEIRKDFSLFKLS